MSGLKIIEALCYVCDLQNKIIRAQSLRLAELGAVCMTDEIAEADMKLKSLLDPDEAIAPDGSNAPVRQ